MSGHVDLGGPGHPSGAGEVYASYLYYENERWNPPSNDPAGAYTDSAGNFTLDVGAHVIVAFDYAYTGSGDYLSPDGAWLLSPADPAVIHFTGTTASTSVTLPLGGEFRGRVTDHSGAPVAGVVVSPSRAPSPDDSATYDDAEQTETAADGTYLVRAVRPGDYRIHLDATAGPTFADQWRGADITHPDGSVVTMALGSSVSGIDVALKEQAWLEGVVTCATCFSSGTVSVELEARATQTSPWVVVYPLVDLPGAGSYSYLTFIGDYRVIAHYTGPEMYPDVTSSVITTRAGQTTPVPPLTLTQSPVIASGVPPATGAFITALYFDFLSRRPAPSEVAHWATLLAQGAPRSSIAAGFAGSDEYRLDCIDAAYHTILGRDPDGGGRLSWLDAMHRGLVTTDDVNKYFYSSAEYTHRSFDPMGWVGSLYHDILGRAASVDEEFSWAVAGEQYARDHNEPEVVGFDEIDQNWVVNQIYNSNEAAIARVAGMYQKYLGRSAGPSELAGWAPLDAQLGDSVVRAGFTASDEYFARASFRYTGA